MERRGSDLLKERYAAKGFAIHESMIDELSEIVGDNLVHDVNVKGIPAVDFTRLTFEVEDDRCGTTIQQILQLLGRHGGTPGKVVVFPKGIPWPELVQVEVEIGAR
jgi:hypothetical protein